jgi:hypothetical protein
VITAAHCLTDALLANGTGGLPPPHPGRYLEEQTYRELLGPLGADPTVWATCLFVIGLADSVDAPLIKFGHFQIFTVQSASPGGVCYAIGSD